MFGAETILMDRAANEQVFQDITLLINNFKQYFVSHGQEIYENPSPVIKTAASQPWRRNRWGVLKRKRHRIRCTPLRRKINEAGVKPDRGARQRPCIGYGLAARGPPRAVHDGRGTPFGGPVPTVKIATNSELAARKSIGLILMQELCWKVKAWMSFMRNSCIVLSISLGR